MARVLLIGCDPADEAILQSKLREAGHHVVPTEVADLTQGGLLEQPWDLVLSASQGPGGSFAHDVAPHLAGQPWRSLASVLVFESPSQEEEAFEQAILAGADNFVDRAHIEALLPAVESCLRRTRRLAGAYDRLRTSAITLRRLRSNQQGVAPVEAQQASSQPRSDCGCLLVNSKALVVGCNLEAAQLLGREPRGLSLRELAPARALDAPFRSARQVRTQGEPFDVSPRGENHSLTLRSSCVPLGEAGENGAEVLILLYPEAAAPPTDQEPSLPSSWVKTLSRARRSLGASRIVAHSAAGVRLRSQVREFAEHRAPLSIVGEDGVGRASIGRCVHYENPMAGSFHELRTLAFSDLGLERELFGARGLIARLDGADTLLISHADYLPAELQDRLAAALRSRGEERLSARLLLTSGTDGERLTPALQEAIGDSVLLVPPLRERAEDLPKLAREALAAQTSRRPLPELTPQAIARLQAAPLRGNLDDLEAALNHALAMSDGDTLDLEHLPGDLLQSAEDGEAEWAEAPWSITDADPISLDVYERKAIQRALASCRGDKVAAAQLLEVGRSTLYRKLRNLGLG